MVTRGAQRSPSFFTGGTKMKLSDLVTAIQTIADTDAMLEQRKKALRNFTIEVFKQETDLEFLGGKGKVTIELEFDGRQCEWPMDRSCDI
jgi:hypothetical protein